MTRLVSLDPHVHTAASYDSDAPVEAVLDGAARTGLDAVAITDHDTMAGVEAALESTGTRDVVVVPGVEVSTADGHLLALGVADRPTPDRPVEGTIETVHEQGGAAVIPHPFQRSRHGVRRSIPSTCDGLEVYNAIAMTGLRNRRALTVARRDGFPRLGGSDAHTPAMVGRAYTEVELATDTEPVTADAIVSAIRAGRTEYAGHRAPLRRYLDKYARNIRHRALARLTSVPRPSH